MSAPITGVHKPASRKMPAGRLDQIPSDGDWCSGAAKEAADAEIDQRDTDAKPQQQEAEARPAIRKGRK